MAQTRRKSEGSVFTYSTKGGNQFYRWQAALPIDVNDPSAGKKRYSKGGYITYKEADKAMQDAVHESEKGRKPITDATLFGDYASDWLASLKIANSTRLGYEKILRVHLLPKFGKQKLTQITGVAISAFYRQLETNGSQSRYSPGKGLSSNTVNKIHIVLGSILQLAVYEGKLNTNPARHNPKVVNAPTGADIRKEQKELETWTAEQLEEFLFWNVEEDGDDLWVLWLILSWTGMRRGEAVALKWQDINFTNSTIAIRRSSDSGLRKAVKTSTKTNKNRSVYIDAETMGCIQVYKSRRAEMGSMYAEPDAYLFGTSDGSVRNPGDVGERFARAVKSAQVGLPNLPHLTIKGLRHTHATLLLESGVNPKIVQERLGHSNISTTLNIYSHVTPTMQESALEGLRSYVNKKAA